MRLIPHALKCAITHVSGPDPNLVAEEEGFYFPESKGGTCWHALVRHKWNGENKEFASYRMDKGF